MLTPRLRAYRDLGDYVILLTLERPSRTRKLFSQVKFVRRKYADGFGVREFKFEIRVFD